MGVFMCAHAAISGYEMMCRYVYMVCVCLQ